MAYLGLKSAKYSELSLKEFGMFAANLKAALGPGLGKYVLATFSAEALVAVINETKQDSSRAAANWDLAIGTEPLRTGLSPSEYGEEPAGQRGDSGANAVDVLRYKGMVYGFDASQDPVTVLKGGALADGLGIGSAGNPKVILYNPILSDNMKRRQGWQEPSQRTGNTYAQNAWPVGAGASLSGLAGKVSASFTQKLVEINFKIRAAAKAGRVERYWE